MQTCGFHSDSEAGEDVGGGSGFGGGGYFFDAAVVAGGVVFCGGSYEEAADYSGDDREEEGEVAEHPVGEEVGAYYHEEAGGAEAYSEGFGGVSSFFDSDEEGAEYGGYYAYGGEEERVDDSALVHDEGSYGHCGYYGVDVGFKEVGSHSRYVSDVVSDVVGYDCGVAGVVFGDSGFDFADEVGSYVGGFGVDASADSGEEGYGAGSEAEGCDYVGVRSRRL